MHPAARNEIAGRLSNPAIATKLYLSRRTVETHVSHILAKLRVHSRAGIVRTTAEAASRADQEPTTSASTCR